METILGTYIRHIFVALFWLSLFGTCLADDDIEVLPQETFAIRKDPGSAEAG